MMKYDFILAFRNLARQKGYAIINITGLSVGFLCAIFIALWVKNETGYDKFHQDAGKIYRVYTDAKFSDNLLKAPFTPYPLGETMQNEIPEIKEFVRVLPFENRAIQFEEKIFYEDNFYFVDSTFFNVFTVEFVAGSPETALNEPNNVVITQKIAQKYFGATDPLGKSFRMNNSDSTLLEVTGVVKEFPENSHFQFDFLTSLYTTSFITDIWLNASCVTYFRMNREIDVEEIEGKMMEIANVHIAPQLKEFFGYSTDQFAKEGNYYNLKLQPLTDIHLMSDLQYEMSATGDLQTIYIFVAVAVLILVIAGINFTNLSTAKYSKRLVEVGIKKTVGAERRYLMFQFIAESVILVFIALFFSLILAEVLIPVFNRLFGTRLHFLTVANLDISFIITGSAIIVGILSGLYPAVFLSSFSPAAILKGNVKPKRSQFTLRNMLVVFQFIMSFLVILGTFIIVKQLSYVQQRELGFDSEKVIVIERTDPIRNSIKPFMEQVKTIAGVENVALSSGIPGRDISMSGFMIEGKPSYETYLLSIMEISDQFVPTAGLTIAKGRNFTGDLASDSMAVLINESAARNLGLHDPVGKHLVTPGREDERIRLNIVGVVKDFHFKSLHEKIQPVLLISNYSYFDGYISVRIEGASLEKGINQIKDVWNTFAPGFPMVHFFLDKEFEQLYESEKQISRILSFFAVITIFIACLGLLGLASYTTERKTKEIGIRKAVGANETSIVYLLSRGFLKWVVIAIVIATPIAVIWSGQWLQRFAYQTSTPWWIYLLAGIITLIIAQLSVMYQSMRAALKNPVSALRYE